MFRGHFDDDSADEDEDEDAATARDELTRTSDATAAQRPTSQAPTNAPATTQKSSPYTTAGTAPARTSLLPANPPNQTTREPTPNAHPSAAARTHQPCRASHSLSTVSRVQMTASQFPVPTSAHAPAPSMTASEFDTFLQPVEDLLRKLKTTTLPPDNGRVSAKSAMQVLRERVLPVGRYVLQRFGGVDEGEGGVEVDVCTYIAKHYWPQHLVKADGMRVMEVYRNAVFRERVEYEHRVVEEEEEERRREEMERGFVDEGTEVPGLASEHVWEPQAGEEVWMPADTREELPRLEVDGTYEDGHVWEQQLSEQQWRPVAVQDEMSGLDADGIYDDEDGGVPVTNSGSWDDEARWWSQTRRG